MSSILILFNFSKSIFKNDIKDITTLTWRESVFHFFFALSIIAVKLRFFTDNPKSFLTFSIIASSIVGISNWDSTIILLILSTSIPWGCGRIIVGGGGISFTNLGWLNFCPFGSSKVIEAYGVINEVS